jgi:hypothetical protein
VQQVNFADEFKAALLQANTLRPAARTLARAKGGNPRQILANKLMKGQAPTTSDPTQITKFGQFATSLALDMAYDRHISRANARRLHKYGYKVSDLPGATTYEDWYKTLSQGPH